MTQLLHDDAGFSELTAMLTGILRDVAPDERTDFAQARANMLAGRTDARGALRTEGPRMRAIPGVVEAGLLGLHLLSGTLAVVEIFRQRNQRREELRLELSLQQEWRQALIDAGVPRTVAETIPLRYSAEMIRFLTRQRLGVSRSEETPASD